MQRERQVHTVLRYLLAVPGDLAACPSRRFVKCPPRSCLSPMCKDCLSTPSGLTMLSSASFSLPTAKETPPGSSLLTLHLGNRTDAHREGVRRGLREGEGAETGREAVWHACPFLLCILNTVGMAVFSAMEIVLFFFSFVVLAFVMWDAD